MLITLKDLFFWGCKKIGIYAYFRKKQRGGVVILTYHSVVSRIPDDKHDFEYRNCVTTTQFEAQIRFMLRHYKPIRIAELVDGKFDPGTCCFLITFDDGFRNNIQYAVPILQKYELQGCFFVSTGLIARQEMIWPEKITYLIMGSVQDQLELSLEKRQVFPLRTPQEREKASCRIRRYLKSSTQEKITRTLADMERQLTAVKDISPEDKEERYAFMNWEEIQEMTAREQIVGSHTHTHSVLTSLDATQSLEELATSRELLASHSGNGFRYFSYPNGAPGDFTETHKDQLRRCGYVCAMSQIAATNFPGGDLFELRRINISRMMTETVFEAAVCGFLSKTKRKH